MKQSRIVRANRALSRSLDRYLRREAAYQKADAGSDIWRRRGTSAMALVKEARDLSGRLERLVYEGGTL